MKGVKEGRAGRVKRRGRVGGRRKGRMGGRKKED